MVFPLLFHEAKKHVAGNMGSGRKKLSIRKNLHFPMIFAVVRTAVLAGNDTFLTENITEDRKKLITQSKHMIF